MATVKSRAKSSTPGQASKKARSSQTKVIAGKPKNAAAVPATPQPLDVPKPKNKLVRDSFTIPKSEYAVLESLKLRAAKLARPTKKSEVLRAGIAALNAMTDKAFLATLQTVPSIKTGRPASTPTGKAKSA